MALPDEYLIFRLSAHEAKLLYTMRGETDDPDLRQLQTRHVRSSFVFSLLELLGLIVENEYDSAQCWWEIEEWYMTQDDMDIPLLYIPLE